MGIFADLDKADYAGLTAIALFVLAGIALFVDPDKVAWLVGAGLGAGGFTAGAKMG